MYALVIITEQINFIFSILLYHQRIKENIFYGSKHDFKLQLNN